MRNFFRKELFMLNEEKICDQTIIINGRKTVTIDKVMHIVRFDEETLVIDTDGGRIILEGEELKVMSLDKENKKISITGKISGVFYSEESLSKRGIGKLFR